MPLDITSIKDRAGAALYIISTADTHTLEKFTRLCEDVREQTQAQVLLIDTSSPDARAICDFYDIPETSLPIALIVRDDDTIVEQWQGAHIPFNASDIAFRLNQVG